MKFVPSTEEDIQWFAERADELDDDAKGITAIDNKGDIAGVCAFDRWTQTSAHMNIAIDNPLCLKNYYFIYEVMNYAFITADRLTLIANIKSNNVKSLRFTEHIGFKYLITIDDGYSKGVGIVIYELRRDHCKWINREAA